MSRGIGTTQRRALLYLYAPDGKDVDGVPLTELKRHISTDRSNTRRAIRGLIERGMLEEFVGAGGERRVKISGPGSEAMWLAAYPYDVPPFERIPSRALDGGIFGPDVDELPSHPLESPDTSWISDALDASAVSDPPDNPMRGGIPHTRKSLYGDRPISDNAADSAMQAGLGHANEPVRRDKWVNDHPNELESLVARCVRRVLERRGL